MCLWTGPLEVLQQNLFSLKRCLSKQLDVHIIGKKEPSWEVLGSNLVSDKIFPSLSIRFSIWEGYQLLICSNLIFIKQKTEMGLMITFNWCTITGERRMPSQGVQPTTLAPQPRFGAHLGQGTLLVSFLRLLAPWYCGWEVGLLRDHEVVAFCMAWHVPDQQPELIPSKWQCRMARGTALR